MAMLHTNTALSVMDDLQDFRFMQTYNLKQGINKFAEKGIAAVYKEMRQLYDRIVFEPIMVNKMTKIEEKKQWKAWLS